ncbi:MAG TPA: VanW family protein [bacterium]|nr:VanW family protein [bacterium]HNS33920.1 VanW family protein [bacterium]
MEKFKTWWEQPFKQIRDGRIDKRWLIITILVAFFIMLTIAAGIIIAFEIQYRQKFFPGSKIGNISLGGLTPVQALENLEQITENIEKEGIKIIYRNHDDLYLKVTPMLSALTDPDLSRAIIDFDNHSAVYDAFAYGRNGNWWQNIKQQMTMLFTDKKFKTKVEIDEPTLKKNLQEQFSDLEQTVQNAKPLITWQGDNYRLDILPEQSGQSFDFAGAINELRANLEQLKNDQIELISVAAEPTVTKSQAEQAKQLIEQVLSTTSPQFQEENQTWIISKADLSTMLEFYRDDNEIKLGINQDGFYEWLDKNIGTTLNVEPQDANIEMKDGKVTKLTPHVVGKQVNRLAAYQQINQGLLSDNLSFTLTVDTALPKIVTGDINDLGINEIVGTGQSNFAGSSQNRRHNIKNGASRLHGILIKPDEEFSLITALGNIDATTGYLPELVIKGSKTVPEYGGGLCQIGTTIFRAAMASGLPITERRNHSYNVSYYLENGLPGTDATIYIPHPDVRFINNTGHYILIQYRLEGDNLYFDFWGTKDGRTAERTTPKVWGWTSPPPTKYIETTNLAPGQKRCTESSHQGVSAAFDYIITYADGTIDKTTFSSYYRPWQAVCLIGVEKLPEEETADNPEVDDVTASE